MNDGESTILNAAGAPMQVIAIQPNTEIGCSVNFTGCALPSDRRLKIDIQLIGSTVHGLPLYRYRGYEGVMAQDVLSVMPEAVVQGSNGYYAVDYARLGARFRRIH